MRVTLTLIQKISSVSFLMKNEYDCSTIHIGIADDYVHPLQKGGPSVIYPGHPEFHRFSCGEFVKHCGFIFFL